MKSLNLKMKFGSLNSRANRGLALEKEIGAVCPKCGFSDLNVYYEDGGSSPVGAKCDSCGFRGFFLKGELVPLPAMP